MRATANIVGNRLQENTKALAPVAERPFRGRDDRAPGTFKRSIERGRVERGMGVRGMTMRVQVFSEDEAGPFIEYDTRAHVIRPRKPGGRLHWRGPGGEHIFARAVQHPGTTGQHIFARGALETEAQVGEIAAPAMQAFKRDLTGRIR